MMTTILLWILAIAIAVVMWGLIGLLVARIAYMVEFDKESGRSINEKNDPDETLFMVVLWPLVVVFGGLMNIGARIERRWNNRPKRNRRSLTMVMHQWARGHEGRGKHE